MQRCRRGEDDRNIGLPLAALAVLAVASSGCAEEPARAAARMAEPAEIIVEPAELQLAAGSEAELAAQVNDAAGQPIGGAEIDFSVADAGVLAVSQRGRVSSRGPAAESAVIVASGRSSRRVPVIVRPGVPQRIEKLAGDGQDFTAGTAPAAPLAVRALDLAGNPVGGVALVLESEGGQAAATESVTGDDGRAVFEAATVDAAGPLRLRVRERETGTPFEVFELTVRAGAPAAIEVACASLGAAAQGSRPLDVRLFVRDGRGNAAPEATLRARIQGAGTEATEFRTDADGAARLSLASPAKARATVLEILSGDAPLARVTLSPGTAACD